MSFKHEVILKSPLGTFPVGSAPFGIAIDVSGNVWVGNFSSNKVMELSSSGVTLGTFSAGTNPFGVAIDATGNVWVTNQNSNNVTKLQNAAAGPQFFPYSGPVFPYSF